MRCFYSSEWTDPSKEEKVRGKKIRRPCYRVVYIKDMVLCVMKGLKEGEYCCNKFDL